MLRRMPSVPLATAIILVSVALAVLLLSKLYDGGAPVAAQRLSGAPVLCALAVHSPTRLAVPRGSKAAVTNLLGWVWTNVSLEPSGAMN